MAHPREAQHFPVPSLAPHTQLHYQNHQALRLNMGKNPLLARKRRVRQDRASRRKRMRFSRRRGFVFRRMPCWEANRREKSFFARLKSATSRLDLQIVLDATKSLWSILFEKSSPNVLLLRRVLRRSTIQNRTVAEKTTYCILIQPSTTE